MQQTKRNIPLQISGKLPAHPVTIAAMIMTVGIVFGDIGTSPLYVMKAIKGASPHFSADYILGALSCIIWTLILQTTLKYVVIAMRADNKGEGGILALYSLVSRMKPRWLFIPAAIGAGALIADGVITPAVTVTSAIEGVQSFEPKAPVTMLSIAIIVMIFLIQRKGTAAIGRIFGPFMLGWFLMLGVLGVTHIGLCSGVFRAFNPLYAVRLLTHSPEWFLILGAVFLCTTGAEALYSDLGHCGRWNITWSWLFVKIMLILNYLGQGAWLISTSAQGGSLEGNPFYNIMPSWFLPIGVVMSTGAAVIASQALLSGSFTIFSEAMGLKFWPRLKIKYPAKVKGQLYIPLVNAFLFVGCILTVVMFRTSSAMEAAYGLAITLTMLMTTLLLAFWMHSRKVPLWIIAAFCLLFMSLESLFLAANLAKFMHGGWYTLLLACLVTGVMLLWRRAVNTRSKYMEYEPIAKSVDTIMDISADREIPMYANNIVYFSKSDSPYEAETKLIYSIINKQPKRADHYWIVRIVWDDAPDTLDYEVTTIVPGRFFSVEMRIGYRVDPQVSVYLRQVIEDLQERGEVDLLSSYPSLAKRGIPGDFRFVLIKRLYSSSSRCKGFHKMAMQWYEYLHRLGLSFEKSAGLDTSNLSIEYVPLIVGGSSGKRIRPA